MTIETALFERLASVVLDRIYPISWPGVVFDPPADGQYLEVIFMQGQTITRTQDPDGVDHQQGIFQVNVVFPVGVGIVKSAAIADSIINHFPKGLNLESVKVSGKAWSGTPIQEDHKLLTPVSIPWHF